MRYNVECKWLMEDEVLIKYQVSFICTLDDYPYIQNYISVDMEIQEVENRNYRCDRSIFVELHARCRDDWNKLSNFVDVVDSFDMAQTPLFYSGDGWSNSLQLVYATQRRLIRTALVAKR